MKRIYCRSPLIISSEIGSLELIVSAFGNKLPIREINDVILSHSKPLYINSCPYIKLINHLNYELKKIKKIN